ncbi:MAG: type II toxin-antitoxin system VapC family toxin [Hyphomicrobiales bacterium]|nr:type II toxin-antitoxin system VapC family toxin [Hyphomicrobiales bacterium]MBV9907523.1 type II toxin-antitoxin system VapC family toxin [Hyphomicrobiales bacterium]
MMVDASALVAVVRNEAGADRFFRALSDLREPKYMSAANYLEAAIVICFAYALAESMREPLLFKGDDFSHTDVAVA